MQADVVSCHGCQDPQPIQVSPFRPRIFQRQGPFSLRMFHRSWGLMFIQQNITAPSTLLDFPTRERFVRELTSREYDIVGISSIIVNVGKVREMYRLIRHHSPRSTIVVGGHVAAIPEIERMIDADHIVRGEGCRGCGSSWERIRTGRTCTRRFPRRSVSV